MQFLYLFSSNNIVNYGILFILIMNTNNKVLFLLFKCVMLVDKIENWIE